MGWDLGPWGIAVLALMSLAFGVFTEAVFWGVASKWLWLVATGAAFVLGLIVSEAWFGWATEEELQPNIDGLSFDEVLISFLVAGTLVLMARFLFARRRRTA